MAKLSVLMHGILKFKKNVFFDKGLCRDLCLRVLLAQEHLQTCLFTLLCSGGSSLAPPWLLLADLFQSHH